MALGLEGEERDFSRDVNAALASHFPHVLELRPLQRAAINGQLLDRDVSLEMETGGGKTLCFQLPALVAAKRGKGVTIVQKYNGVGARAQTPVSLEKKAPV